MLAHPDRVLAVGRARARYVWLWWSVFVAFFFGGLTVIEAVLRPAGKEDPRAVPGALYGLIVGVVGAVVVSNLTQNRPVPIVVDGAMLRFGRFGSAPVASAVVGPWYQASSGVWLGSVLHLAGDRGPIVVGGRRYRARATGDPRHAARTVHVSVSAAEFEKLLAVLDPGASPVHMGGQ